MRSAQLYIFFISLITQLTHSWTDSIAVETKKKTLLLKLVFFPIISYEKIILNNFYNTLKHWMLYS